MSKFRTFQEIEAWKTARELTSQVYKITDTGQFGRDFGLKDQIRRASVSILSNIAEGFESRTPKLFIDFLGRAKASAGEVRAQLFVALDCRYVSKTQFDHLYDLAAKAAAQTRQLMRYLENVQRSTFNVQRFQ